MLVLMFGKAGFTVKINHVLIKNNLELVRYENKLWFLYLIPRFHKKWDTIYCDISFLGIFVLKTVGNIIQSLIDQT